jgi:hypothetical protein
MAGFAAINSKAAENAKRAASVGSRPPLTARRKHSSEMM